MAPHSSTPAWKQGLKIALLEMTGTASGQKSNGQMQVKEAKSEKRGIDIKYNRV